MKRTNVRFLLFSISFVCALYSARGWAVCPITVTVNTNTSISDGGTSNCVITVSSGVLVNTAGASILATGSSTSITNSGSVRSSTSYAIGSSGSGTNSITNEGTVTSVVTSGIFVTNSLSLINNSGTISAARDGGVYVTTGTIANFINTGQINVSGTGSGVYAGNTAPVITNFTNNGSITAGSPGYGINVNSASRITRLNNGQGGDGQTANSTALTYNGRLPTNYSIIVGSLTRYGQLVVTNPVGTTTFSIYAGGVSGVATSILTANTYTSVLTGVSAGNLTGATSGTFGSYSWSLVNSAGSNWNLVVTGGAGTSSGGGTDSPAIGNMVTGGSYTLASLGVTVNPVFDGGTLTLTAGRSSAQALTVNPSGGTIQAPTSGSAELSGVLSGSGALNFTGTGTTVLSGVNTYSGGTVVTSGTLSLVGASPTGFGDVDVLSGGTLMGTGTINGKLTVSGVLKPGNSPGYLVSTGAVTMNAGSVYQQDIAGITQASSAAPPGAAGYYSYLNVTGGQFMINSGATFMPRLSNLFSAGESGYGSIAYVPALGDQFRVLTAAGGISGRFATLTQPEGLATGTQFALFYNMKSSNSIDLAIVPSSYSSTIASISGNKNAQSVAAALDRIVATNLSAQSTTAQDQLLYAIAAQNSATGIASYAQSLAGELYAAAVATITQTTQRAQQAVLSRLGDTMGLNLPSTTVASQPAMNVGSETALVPNGNVWGDLAYQKVNRSSDSQAGGWNSNLYQLVFGSDVYANHGVRVGGGIALSNTVLNPSYGSGTIQQGTLFAYGKMPIQEYVLDAMLSAGISSSDLSRGDITSLSGGFRKKALLGNDVLVSLGLSRPVDMDQFHITPFARVTWQIVTQAAVDEGDVASALKVRSFTGNGVRGVIGIALGSRQTNPTTEKYTYRAYVGVGADSSSLVNPMLSASLVGLNTNIATPSAGAAFIQAGLYGTAKIADNAYAYAGLSGEARSGQALGAVNLGVRIAF